MCAQVFMAGSQSSRINIDVRMKQGCVLAPIIVNLILITIAPVSRRDLKLSDSVGIEYRSDGVPFNLRRLQAKTTTSYEGISVLQYADDAALPSLSADGLQRSPDVISETCLHAGLIVNTT